MTKIKIKNNIKLTKNNFIDIFELYEYIEKEYILPDLKFHAIKDLSKEEKKELEKAKKDNANLINI